MTPPNKSPEHPPTTRDPVRIRGRQFISGGAGVIAIAFDVRLCKDNFRKASWARL